MTCIQCVFNMNNIVRTLRKNVLISNRDKNRKQLDIVKSTLYSVVVVIHWFATSVHLILFINLIFFKENYFYYSFF